MRHILCGIGFALLFCGFTPLDTHEDLPFPQALQVQSSHLSNGIKLYIQEHSIPHNCASFRVVFTHPSYGELVYTLDTRLDSSESLDEFFTHCSAKARGVTNPDFDKRYAKKFAPALFGEHLPQKIGVIAIGDFSAEEMHKCIETHFGTLILDQETPPASEILIESNSALPKVALKISLPHDFAPINTYADLKEHWKFLFLQHLLQQRFETCAETLDEQWLHSQPSFLYPTSGFTLIPEDDVENRLAFFLWHFLNMSIQGLDLGDFITQKESLLQHLSYLNSVVSTSDNLFLASYYRDQFLLGNSNLCPRSFLNASLLCVEELQFNDLLSPFNLLINGGSEKIQLVYPTNAKKAPLTKDAIEKIIEQIDNFISFHSESKKDTVTYLCSIQEANTPQFHLANNPVPSTRPFYNLHLTNKEKEFIHSIITTMAHENLVQLAFSKSSLEKKGKRIECVHPLRFLGFILSNRELKDCLKVVKKSSFKWDHFIKGFSKRMKEEHARNNLHIHLPGFAEQVGATQDHVAHYIHKKDWEGLVKSLM